MAECQRCERTDLNLTQNGRVKSHAANGKRAGLGNPHCPGGSDWPREHVRGMARQGDDASAAQLVEWGEDPSGDGTADNRPTADDVRNAEYAVSSGATDDVYAAAEEVLMRVAELGVRGGVHVHRYSYADDDRGHAGSFCACGEEEPTDPSSAAASGAAVHVLAPGDPHWYDKGAHMPTGPNPHRPPVPTGKPEALRAGWTEEQWDDYNRPGGALRRELGRETGEGPWTTQQPSSAGVTTPDLTSGRSSTPVTTASAGSVSNGSARVTSSGPSAAATSSTPNAQGSGSVSSDGVGSDGASSGTRAPAAPANDATAFLNAKNPTGGGPDMAGSNDVPRDRWGRYLLPHPETGRVQPWTRTTTAASSIADTFTLSQWSQRMVAKGITLRPDLYALASGYSVAADRDDMNSVCEQAKTAAGDKVAANLGTAMHTFTAAVDRGMEVNIPPSMVDDVNAYSAALAAYGLKLVPGMIERRVAIVRKTAGEDIAGTFDRVYQATRDVGIKMATGETVQLKTGDYVIGDLKTGRDLAYGWGEIAIQEAIYAHAVNENGIWDPVAKEWITDPLNGAGVSEKVGIVVHLPVQKTEGAPACVMYAVDLEQGWEALTLCVRVREWRKAKRIATPLEVVSQAPRPAAVPAPVADDDAAEVANRRSARELAEGKPRAAVAMTEDTRELNAHGPGSGPQTAVSGYDRPTAAQLADYPSVTGRAAVQTALATDTPPAARPPTWEERADMVSTRAEASAVYNAMRPHVQEIGQTRFSAVVKRMQARLSTLVENGG
jgi:hypothetical protein